MFSRIKLLGCAFAAFSGIAAMPASAVTYIFTSASGQNASFTLTLASPITSNKTFLGADLDQASSIIGKVEFCVHNSQCSLGYTNPAYDEIIVYNVVDPNAQPVVIPNPNGGPPITMPVTTVSVGYDFTSTAFANIGNYQTIAAGRGSLQVAASAPVPEPSLWAMMIGGFGLIGAALRRQRANVRFA